MKAVMVLFDSLNRLYLPAYGGTRAKTPNFDRLAALSIQFSTCYGGSMPCMPARRELHTARYNFLHRSWGPLEPFDDSVPEMLTRAGVYTHIVTDHPHYWEDGGASYCNRFSSFEYFRGQEGDHWKGQVAEPDIPESVSWRTGDLWRHDWVNRQYLQGLPQHSQVRTLDAGLEFLTTNAAEDRWFLQMEFFDPHEPFYSSPEHEARFPDSYDGPHFDWPDYRSVVEDEETVEHAQNKYLALLSLCDDTLGRVLDTFDELDLWADTLLIVCTDHGLLVGERGWWGKNIQPWYEENIHTPLYLWDPRIGARGETRDSLVQTVDLGPTLLEYFDVDPTPDMQGRSISPTLRDDTPVRDTALFGVFGGHVSVTDGRYVYMRASAESTDQPLFEHTLVPNHMASRFTPAELIDAELVPPFGFTKGLRTLRVPGTAFGSSWAFGSLLFDLADDPTESRPLRDPDLELTMARLLVRAMRANDAPESQFARLGLPATGQVTEEHLLVERQWDRICAPHPVLNPADIAEDSPLLLPIKDLRANPRAARMIAERFAGRAIPATLTLWQFGVMFPQMVGIDALRDLEAALRSIGLSADTASQARREEWATQ